MTTIRVKTNSTRTIRIKQVGAQGAPGGGITWDNNGWVSGHMYVENDGLLSGISTYRCILAHTASATDEPGVGVNWATYWEILAQGALGTGELITEANLEDFPLVGAVGSIYLATSTGLFYYWTGAAYALVTPVHYSSNHVPAGFPDHTATALSLVENVGAVNDTFSVTITGTNFPVFIDGVLQYKNTETISQVAAASTRYYVYYSAAGTLTISASPWTLEPGEYAGEAFVATVLWDAVSHQGKLEEERHHSWRDVQWHHWAHHTIGSRYSQAHSANGFNITNPGADQYATFSISGGELYDEDIVNSQDTATTADLYYHHTDGTMRWDADSTVPYKLVAGVPQYDTGAGLANKTASNTLGYFVSWVYATNALTGSRYAIVVGQDSNGNMTLAEAQNAGAPSLPVDFVVEWKLCWKMIFRYGSGANLTWISNTDYRTAGTLPGGQSTILNVAANAVTYSPTTPDTSTNVQLALDNRALLQDGYIKSQRDVLTVLTPPADGGTVTVDCSLGNAFKITPTDTSGMDYVVDFTNIPAGYFAITFTTITGTNLPSVTYKVGGVSVTPQGTPAFVANKRNRWTVETDDVGASLQITGTTF